MNILKPFRNVSFKRKIFLYVGSICFFCLILACLAFITYDAYSARRVLVRNISIESRVVATTCASALVFQDPDFATKVLTGLNEEPRILAACIYGVDGAIFARYSHGSNEYKFPENIHASGYRLQDKQEYLLIPVIFDNSRIGTLYVHVDLRELSLRKNRYLWIAFGVLSSSLILALLVSGKFQRVITRPLSELERATTLISKTKDYTVRAVKYSDDEFGFLTNSINEMLNQIQKRDLLLSESEEKFRTLYTSSRDAIMTLTPGEGFLSGNPAALEMFGFQNEKEFISQDLATLSPEYQPDGTLSTEKNDQMMSIALDRGMNFFEWVHKRIDGQEFFADILLNRIRLKEDRILQATVRETTDRKQAEASLRESQKTLLTVLDSIDATVYVSDMDSYEILFMNQNMKDAFGGDLVGKRCWEEFRNGTGPCSFCTNDKLLDKEGNPAGVHVWHDQSPVNGRWYMNYDRAIKWPDGRYVRLQVATDITDLKNAQEQLIQAQKMEAIGSLAGGIAHDFNNILSSIIGFTELSLDDVEKGSTIEDNLHEVFVAGKRAKDLVKQILNFARQSDEDIKPVRVDIILKEVLQFIRSSIPTTVEIKQNFESDSMIMGNATQVHQILMNLCTNANYAMAGQNGILEASLKDFAIDDTANGKIQDLKPGKYIKIEVSDTGAGIAPETIGSIFEPYFTTKEPEEGTGMGLAVVHGIVEIYGGKITVDSTLGEGTTFIIYLPTIEKSQKIDTYGSEMVPHGMERILVVDDEPSIAKSSSLILKGLGYKVTTRTSSIEALELVKARANDFDLVITDMTMPSMTGDKLAIEIMKIRRDIPVILCTGYSKKMSDETASEIGIKAVAYKPVVKADLAKTVRKVLDEAKS